jgi:hypothetical protein
MTTGAVVNASTIVTVDLINEITMIAGPILATTIGTDMITATTTGATTTEVIVAMTATIGTMTTEVIIVMIAMMIVTTTDEMSHPIFRRKPNASHMCARITISHI